MISKTAAGIPYSSSSISHRVSLAWSPRGAAEDVVRVSVSPVPSSNSPAVDADVKPSTLIVTSFRSYVLLLLCVLSTKKVSVRMDEIQCE